MSRVHSMLSTMRLKVKVCKTKPPKNIHALCYLSALYFLLSFATALPAISKQFQFVNEYGLGPSGIGMLTGIIGAPWILKPLFAMAGTEYFPIASVLAILVSTTTLMPLPISILVVLLLINQFLVVYIDVCIDGFMVATVQKLDAKGGLQSMTFLSKTLGSVIGFSFGAFIYHSIHDRIAFLFSAITFAILLVLWLVSTTTSKQTYKLKNEPSSSVSKQLKDIFPWIKTNIKFFAFVAICQILPSMGTSVRYYMQTEMALIDLDFGLLSLCTSLGVVIATLSYTYTAPNIRYRPLLSTAIAVNCATSLTLLIYITQFGATDKHRQFIDVIAIGIIDFIDSLIENFSWMPILVIATRISAGQHHSLKYSILTSIMNIGSIISVELSAMIASFLFGVHPHVHIQQQSLLWSVTITECASIIPAIAVFWSVPANADTIHNSTFQESIESIESQESIESIESQESEDIITVTL